MTVVKCIMHCCKLNVFFLSLEPENFSATTKKNVNFIHLFFVIRGFLFDTLKADASTKKVMRFKHEQCHIKKTFIKISFT